MSGESVQFGPYELVRRIGAGGMAETFLGVKRGAHGFEQRVCLKRILSAYESDAELVEMFLAEARVSASLRHANITQVIDFGEAEGLHYLALEMIDGMDLRGLVKAMTAAGERLSAGLVTHLATQLGAALAHAHAQGVVHRDVSPSNVLVSRAGEVKLTDFGIAKAKSMPDMTATGVVKGKVPYMAPEYATSGKIDPRGDLFSLGVTLFECLTGGPRPYDGATDLETLGKSTTGEHAPLWQAAPHATPVLAAAIERLIKPDPAARFATAGELLDALAAEPAPASAARDLEALVRRYEKAPPASSFSLPPSRSRRESAPQVPAARSSGRLVVSLVAAAAVLIGVVIGLVVAAPGSGPDRAEADRPIASAPAALTVVADDASVADAGAGRPATDAGPADATADAGDGGPAPTEAGPGPRTKRPPRVPLSYIDQARLNNFRRMAAACGFGIPPDRRPFRTTAIFEVQPAGNFRLRYVPPLPENAEGCIRSRATHFMFDRKPEAHTERVALTLQ